MVQTIIEIRYDTDSNGNLILAGDPNEQAYEQIKPYLTAIEHNMNNGVASTLYRVDDDASQGAIDTMVGTDSSHADHGIQRGIERGMEIQPGTPTSQEVDDLNSKLSNVSASTPDLTTAEPRQYPATHIFNDLPSDRVGHGPPSWAGDKGGPGASGHGAPEWAGSPGKPPWAGGDGSSTFADIMKNDYPDIGAGNWVCTHPDHSSPEVNQVGSNCSLGHSDDTGENEYASPHREPFDPTDFL